MLTDDLGFPRDRELSEMWKRIERLERNLLSTPKTGGCLHTFPIEIDPVEVLNPYWNIEVCERCGGSGNEPSGVEYAGISEMVGCEECYGIGYTNERIREVLEQLEGMI